MKKRLIFLLFILAINIHIFAQDVELITYNESYQSFPSLIRYAPLRAKTMRKTDNHGGQISINYNSSNIPDSLKQAIEIATLLWEECLPVEAKITIDVCFGNNLSDMSVTVPYVDCSNDTIYALSYYNTYKGNYTQYNEGTVLFSDAIDWCCQYSQGNGNNKKCLSTAMLRAIAITLGFGSTVKKNNQGSIYFDNNLTGYSPFEYLIFNDSNIPLSSIPKGRKNRDNQLLHSYSEPSDTLWLKWGVNQYKLYAPTSFVEDKSLIYLNAPSSLMHFEMPIGSKYLDIDSTTKSIIQAIGWHIAESPPINVFCQDIPSTGIASVYNSYLFGINNYVSDMSSLHWEYQVKSTNGDYQTVCQQFDGQTFLVSPSTYLSLSHVNPEGDIDAMIRLTYILNNEEKTVFLKLTFECAPKILSINDESVHDNGYSTLYDYSFNVAYRGATSITVGIEQEYSSYYDIIHINEPFLAHAYLRYLSKGNMVWVDVSVTNEYGTDLETIEIPIQSRGHIKAKSSVNIHAKTQENNICYIDIYSIDGTFVNRIQSISELSNYHSCTLLLQYFGINHQLIQSRKIHLK